MARFKKGEFSSEFKSLQLFVRYVRKGSNFILVHVVMLIQLILQPKATQQVLKLHVQSHKLVQDVTLFLMQH